MKNKDTLLLEEAYSLICEQRRIQLIEEGIFQDVFSKVKDKLTKFGGDFPKKLATVYSKLIANPNLSKIIKVSAIAAPLMMIASGNLAAAAAEMDINDIKEFIDSVYDLIANNQLTDSSLQDTLKSYDVSQEANVYTNQSRESLIQDIANMEAGAVLEPFQLNSVTELLTQALTQIKDGVEQGVVGEVYVEVIETVGLETGNKNVMIEVSGDVVASSQEEANKIMQDKIAEILKSKNISLAGLKPIVNEAAGVQANSKQKFHTKILVTLNYKKA